jgi:hypothetical protein
MSSYPATIRRCQHIKVNGTQCGSPAVREHNYCYFHVRWHRKGREVNAYFQEQKILAMPSLEDANSIQVGLAEVMRQLGAQMIDHKTAALFLYALQIASANVKFTNFEPEQKTQVIIDRECVSKRPLGASAWSMQEGKEYDDPEEPNSPAKNEDRSEDRGEHKSQKKTDEENSRENSNKKSAQ